MTMGAQEGTRGGAATAPEEPRVETREEEGGGLRVGLTGPWTVAAGVPDLGPALDALEGASRVTLDGAEVDRWDSGLVRAVLVLRSAARERDIPVDVENLPPGAVRLADLAEAVPEKTDAQREDHDPDLLTRVGLVAAQVTSDVRSTTRFVGELALAFTRWATGRGIYRTQDLLLMLRRTGIEALGITALVSFLLGLILAFIGAIQLEKFGATIFVADLVGVGMVRDMGALMTGIVMAGRSGAAFAAEIGTMKATQEIDALETNGVSPMDFLVLPRVLALTAMMPVLTVFADVVGVFGGMFVSWGMLDISPTLFLKQTTTAVTVGHFVGGLVKGLVYGFLVAVAGCMRGLEAGNNSLAVGAAATSAVVTGIVWLIATCGLFQWVQYVLGV
ncbi:MAG: ABC transporter permease [Gemmatimonadota bacterium]